MPLHHYLPAAYVGGFSTEVDWPRRQRGIWCLRRGSAEPFRTTPAKIGAKNDLYTLFGDVWTPQAIDEIWTYYETTLPSAIQELTDAERPLDANTWVRTLVPFVTSLFVRGREFEQRYGARVPRMTAAFKERSPDRVNFARAFEFQRLLAQVATAHWGVATARDRNSEFVTNDLGISVAGARQFKGGHGWLIPLDRSSILTVTPTKARAVAFHSGLGGKALIARTSVTQAEVDKINYTTAYTAQEFVVSNSRQWLTELPKRWLDPPDPVWLSGGWGCDHKERVAHEFDWHRLASVAGSTSSTPSTQSLQRISPWIYGQPWCPPPILPSNLPEFRTGLHLKGNKLWIELGPRKGFPGDPEYPATLKGTRPPKS
ncbi:hypothetical protein GCM10023346_22620 [Arthrobacter gyeryongensis]|uniref:DUF4238 domain-containing protein n=1 Tax=Arthrobacter gyeryongensis TaxID=1650592 RepID=A0ABP9SDT9_9MICC